MGVVAVPSVFVEAGYSGTFYTTAGMAMTPDEVLEWRGRVPCLLGNSGWLALSVDDDDRMVVVRRDDVAIVEALTRRPPVARPDH